MRTLGHAVRVRSPRTFGRVQLKTIKEAKTKARLLIEFLAKQGIRLSHSASLEALAAMEAVKDWNVLAARLREAKAVSSDAPRYCPSCGAEHTLEHVGGAFVEQGMYVYDEYEYEGDAAHYACSACGYQFLDWSIDLGDETLRKQYAILVMPGKSANAVALAVPLRIFALKFEGEAGYALERLQKNEDELSPYQWYKAAQEVPVGDDIVDEAASGDTVEEALAALEAQLAEKGGKVALVLR